MDDTRQQRLDLITHIEAERKSRVLCYALSDGASVADDAIPPLYHQLLTMGRQQRLDVVLTARGGAPESVWRVLGLLREFADHLSVVVAFRIYSAATFIALGADEIVMTPLSELGTTHIQTASPLAPVGNDGNPVWVNPYDMLSFIDLAKSLEVSGDSIIAEMGVHPLVIGSAMRAYNITKQVARKCMGLSKRPSTSAEIDKVVEAFVGGHHSSTLGYSRLECATDLRLPVTFCPNSLEQSLGMLMSLYGQKINYSSDYETDPISKHEYRTVTPAIIETLKMTQVHKRRLEKIPGAEGAMQEVPGWGGWMDDTIQEAF